MTPLPHPSRARRWALPVVAALLGAAPAAGASLGEMATAIDRPRVGAPVAVEGPLRLGRGTIELSAGSAVRPLSCADEPCGVLVGRSRFVYRIEDRFSRPTAALNFKRLSGVAPRADSDALVAALDLTGAVVWGWELAAEAAAGGAPAGGAGAEGEGLPAWAAEILDQALFIPPSHDLVAARRLDGGGEIYALLHGAEDWLLGVDPVVARLEGLWRIGRLSGLYDEFKGRRVLRELAAQPIGRAWWEHPPAPLVATRQAIAVDNPRGAELTVRTRTRVEAGRGAVGVWRAGLLERAFDNDGVEVLNRVAAVTVNGKPAAHAHRGGELLVAIDPPLGAGQAAEIEVVNGGALAIRPGNDSYWFWLGPWYPSTTDNAERATGEIELRVPAPFTPFASGAVVERTSGDGYATVRTRLDHPSQYLAIAAGRYDVFEDSRGGLTARVASYAGGKERASRQLIQNLFAAAEFYGQLFNRPYPFNEVSVVEVNSWGFGIAPAGVVFITQEAYDPIGDVTSRFFSEGVNERYVHEVAHAWWGHVSRAASDEEAWLNESFSEYSAALCLQAMRGGGKAGDREFQKLLREWASRSKQIGDGASLYLALHLGPQESDDDAQRDYAYLVYGKGPLVLHALRQELARTEGGEEQGDRYFFALLRTFLKHVEPGWGETRHLVGILDQITGKDWQPWFERYVYGTETPAVSFD